MRFYGRVPKNLKSLVHYFRFESKEMEASYAQFQRDNERILLTFCNLVSIPFTVIMLIFSLTSSAPIERILVRLFTAILSIIAYFMKNKYPKIQKFLLFVVTGVIIYVSISNMQVVWKGDDMEGGFVVGNMMGLLEVCLILSLKDMWSKTFLYISLFALKIINLYDALFEVPSRGAGLLFVIFALIFYLSDAVLDRKNFKIIYESRDKLKKFQELLSNDLPSSVVIISSTCKKIKYANKFFQTTFQDVSPIAGCQNDSFLVFKKFMIDENVFQEPEFHRKDISLYDFLQRLETNKSIQLDEAQVLRLSAIYKNEGETQFNYEIKLRKIVWEGKTSYAMVLHNISDKQMVIALKLADQQKDKVIATVSHELRTPINGILGLLEMVIKRTIDTLSLEYLDYAKSCSKLLLYLVNSILDLSQLRHNSLRINKEYFNLDKFLGELKSLYIFHSQQKNIEFVVHTDNNVSKHIYTDKYRLIEILINLLGNAMKFTFEGSITLNVSVDQNDNQKLMFCVEDTGIGIKEADKSKLFQMFGKIEQVDRRINTHGVGLGLTIANELVKALNKSAAGFKEERIQFESELGKGTKFWFRIDVSPELIRLSEDSLLSQLEIDFAHDEIDPAFMNEYSPESVDKLEKKLIGRKILCYENKKVKLEMLKSTDSLENIDSYKKMISNTQTHTNGHVLIVDDSPFNLMAASYIIEQLGYSTQKAFNGKECLRLLENSDTQYSVIFTDIQMPVLDGLEMSKIITQKIKRGEIYYIPIVAVTALTFSPEEKKKYQECGIQYTLEKPLEPEKVQIILNKLIQKEIQDNQEFT